MTKDAGAQGDAKSVAIGCGVITLGLVLVLAFCSSTSEPSVPEKPGETAKQDAVAFYKGVIAAGQACDSQFAIAGKALGEGDPVAAYRKVQLAEDRCLGVGSDIKAIEVPVSVGKEQHAKLSEARESCSTVYINKWAALDDIGEILDGDGGVAKMAGVQDSLEQIQSGTIGCVAGMMGPLVALGVDMNTLQAPD